MMLSRWMSRAALLGSLCAAPLAAQPDAPGQPTCVRQASTTMGMAMTRHACAGTGGNAAVRLAAALPDGWDVEWQDAGYLVLSATQGDIVIQVAGVDQLPEPRTAEDTVGFWMRATGARTGAEVESADEVDAFRDESGGQIDAARREVTLAQLDEEMLRAMVNALSVGQEHTPTRHEVEVRELAGEPAGYLTESWTEDGTEWDAVYYITARDGVLFIASLLTPKRTYVNVIDTFDAVTASFTPRAERW